MKKHLLLSFCATGLLFLTSAAQVFSKKDRLFGASAGLLYHDINDIATAVNDRRNTNIGLVPSFAWGVKDNLAIGIKARLGYSRSVYRTPALEKVVQNGLQVGPDFFVRKYKTLVKGFGVSFSHELSGYYLRQENRQGSDILKNHSWGTGYSFIPGAFYKFTDRLLGEANFGGASVNYSKSSSIKQWSAAIDFLSYFNIGVQFIIPSKKV
jgi:hypothetical protein